LSKLFNVAVIQGTFPNCFKVAEIIPIYKNGNASKVINYRPISLLSQFDKIKKKLIYNRLISNLKKYKLLNERQFGFRKNYSTTMAISNICDKLFIILFSTYGAKFIQLLYFLRLVKSFDTVYHKLLLNKMEQSFGIRRTALKLFKSYLSDRYQYIKAKNATPLI